MVIVPDTKDWTWVLERPCPECGFDASMFPAEQTGTMLRGVAEQWRVVLDRGDDVVRRRPDESTWSPLEYACHIRDVCVLYEQRLGWMLTEDDPHFPNWDQDVTAVEERYGDQEATSVAVGLVAAAESLAARFDGVTGDQWLRTGQRGDGASFTVDTFARYFIHDPVHHLHDVSG